ncbi:MAG TPA: tubulin-like doman-containing protein, partial [Pirellulales bacterium]
MSAPSSATPPPTAGTQAAARPTVFIGLGGAATLVLQKLRQRLVESAPEDGLPRPSRSDCDGVAPVSGLSEYPPVGRPAGPSGEKDGPAARPTIAPSQPNEGSRKCFKFLAIDTDRAGLQQAQEGENGAALSPAETLHLPLRKPAEYRQSSDEILSWLSRRWLYNIPRSLRTDGLRPLGRLVFVDHRAAIAERLRRLLQGAPPRVFIIASIDGGAGGGMLIDAAYAVRQQLDQLKLSADCFCGVMLHGTLAGNPANDLRRANAYATLTELNHYMRGDAAFRAGPVEVLPVGDVSEPPFRDAYLVQLGDELTPGDFERSLRSVAEYLYLNASGGAAALDRFRRESRAEHTAEAAVRLRGFSLYAARANKHAVARQEAERFCRRLIQDWSGDDIDESSARSRLQPPALALEQLTERVRSLADQALGGNAEAHFRTVILSEAKLAPPHDRLDGRFGGVLRRVHAVLGTPMANSDQPNDAGRLEPRLAGGAKKLAATIGGALIDSLEALVEQPLARLPAALAGVGLYQQHLRELRQAAEQALECDRAQAQAVWVRLQRGNLPAERFWFSR